MSAGFLRVESYRRGFVLSSMLSVLDNLLAFVPSVLVAYYFGAQSGTDVYFYCVSTIALIVVLMTSMTNSVIIPEFMQLEERVGGVDAIRFVNFFLYAYFVFGVVISSVVLIDPVSMFTAISRFDEHALWSNRTTLYWAVPLLVLQPFVLFLSNVLYSRRFFTVPMLSNITNRLFSIVALLLLREYLGIRSLLAGLILATLLQIFCLLLLLRFALDWDFRASREHVTRGVVRDLIMAFGGNIASTLSTYVPIFLLSGFAAGIVTGLSYAQRLINVPAMFLTTQLSALLGIKFNELAAKADWDNVRRTFHSVSRLLLFVIAPVTVLCFVCGRSIVVFLYQRGEFGDTAVRDTTLFFRYLSLTLPALAINAFVSRLLMASRKVVIGVWYQVAANVLTIAMVWIAVGGLGPAGYPYAMVLFQLINLLAITLLMNRLFPAVRYGVLLLYLFRLSVIMFCIGWAATQLLRPMSSLPAFAQIVAGGCFIGGGLLLVNHLFPICGEFNEMINDLGKKLLRTGSRPPRGVSES